MRNFKKFLALVLAMLMVSACAVSVAAFNDQEKIDKNFSQYKNAIAMLEELGVVQGDENKNYNPEKTLTRAEAAVIIAKLVAGAAGQSMDWTAETTKFADVDAKWSFAYINYVAERKIMVGTDLGFEPNRELKIDEALTLALKAVDPAELRAVEILYAQAPTAYWGTYYINAAEELGLTAGLETIYDPEAACSRAMFAQVAFNMVNFEKDPTPDNTNNKDAFKPIGDGFGYATVTTTVKSVDAANGIVKLADSTIPEIKLDAFNAALKDAGVEKTAADLVNYKISMQWSTKTFAIYGIEVLTKIDTYTYATDAIKYVPTAADPNAAEGKKLEINGKIYDIADDDKAAGAITQIGGSSAADTNNIRIYNNPIKTSALNEITTVVKGETIPAFYTVDCYDDNGDGDYERAYVTEYVLVTFTKSADKVNHDHKDTTDPVYATVVKEFAANGSEATKYLNKDRYLTVAGAGYTAWGETPVLANILVVDNENISAKILETADTATGVVGEIAPGKSIQIDDETILYAAGFATPADWVYGQKVTVYTIGGKYVSVASASTGIESGKVDKTILVDNVTIADGIAMIEGYEYANGTLTALAQPLKVVGADVGGKLLPKYAFNQEADVDYNLNTKDDDDAFALVYLADKKADGKPTGTEYLLEDQKFYDFKVTAEGAYFVTENTALTSKIPTGYSNSVSEVKIADGYLRVNDVATFKMEGTYVVVTNKEVEDEKAYTAYTENTLTVTANGTIPANNYITYVARDKNLNGFTDTINNKVAFVFVDEINAKNPDAKKYMTLAESGVKTIVQVYEKVSAALDYTKYNAIDIFTGEVVSVIAKPGYDVDLTAAGVKYASINEAGEIISNNPVWLADFNVTVVKELGVVTSVSTLNKYLQSDYNTTKKDFDAATLRTAEDKLENKISVNTDSLTIWKLDAATGKIVKDTTTKYEANTTVYGFVNNGTIIVLPE